MCFDVGKMHNLGRMAEIFARRANKFEDPLDPGSSPSGGKFYEGLSISSWHLLG